MFSFAGHQISKLGGEKGHQEHFLSFRVLSISFWKMLSLEDEVNGIDFHAGQQASFRVGFKDL